MDRSVTFQLVLAAILVAACTSSPASTGPAATPGVTPPATRAPTPAPTVAVTPTPVPNVSSTLLADEPILEGSDLGPDPEHYDFTLSASYFTDSDVHHSYVVAFGHLPGDQQAFHASSTDGIEWTVDDDDPLAAFASTFSPPGPAPATVMPAPDGSWVMYLWGVPTSLRYSQIYRATAASPQGPWSLDGEAVLPFGEPGDDDDLGVDFPAVASTDDGFLMLYGANGGDRPHAARILKATSEDGINWQKQGRVIEPALCGGSDDEGISIPRLFVVADGYLALALMGNDVYLLRSADAETWTCQADEPAFAISTVEGGDRVHSYSAGRDGGEINLMIEALFTLPSGDPISNLWFAQLTGL